MGGWNLEDHKRWAPKVVLYLVPSAMMELLQDQVADFQLCGSVGDAKSLFLMMVGPLNRLTGPLPKDLQPLQVLVQVVCSC